MLQSDVHDALIEFEFLWLKYDGLVVDFTIDRADLGLQRRSCIAYHDLCQLRTQQADALLGMLDTYEPAAA
jgi:hypothetical protein